jgi:hypothetical protein
MKDREEEQKREIKLNCTFEEAWPHLAKQDVETFAVVTIKTGEIFSFETEEAPEMWKDPNVPGYVKITDRAESFEEVVEIMRKHHIVPSDGYPSTEELRHMEEEED